MNLFPPYSFADLHKRANQTDPRGIKEAFGCEIVRLTDEEGMPYYLEHQEDDTWRHVTVCYVYLLMMERRNRAALWRCLIKDTPWPEVRDHFKQQYVTLFTEVEE